MNKNVRKSSILMLQWGWYNCCQETLEIYIWNNRMNINETGNTHYNTTVYLCRINWTARLLKDPKKLKRKNTFTRISYDFT